MDGLIEGGSYDGRRLRSRYPTTKLYHIKANIHPSAFGHIVENYQWQSYRWVFIGAESTALDERAVAFMKACLDAGVPKTLIADALRPTE